MTPRCTAVLPIVMPDGQVAGASRCGREPHDDGSDHRRTDGTRFSDAAIAAAEARIREATAAA